MTVQVEFWQLVLLLVALLGSCIAAFKWLLGLFHGHMDKAFGAIDKRLDGIEENSKEEAKQWQRVERELMELKAHLPDHYVRREDYIRGQTVLENKIDKVAMQLENIQLRSQLQQNQARQS